MGSSKGAGVIPYTLRDGEPLFLFHTTFRGRRAGLIVDFGGGSEAGESAAETAAREFVEETDGMFLQDAVGGPAQTEIAFARQRDWMRRRIERMQREHPKRWCGRLDRAGNRRDWLTYFVRVEYQPVDGMNAAWAEDGGGRFRKRRELFWLHGAVLLDVLERRPHRLWKRVRSLQGLDRIVKEIIADGRPG